MASTKSVGDILGNLRRERRLTIEEVSRELKIHPRFLQALESGDYSVFSGPVHIKGFLKNYADYLGLDVPQTLAFWRREYKGSAIDSKLQDVTQPLRGPKLLITPGVVFSFLIFIAVTAFLGYLFWQYRSIAGPPALKVLSPEADLVSADQIAHLTGLTDPRANLSVNGQKILVLESGRFSFDYVLATGTNVLEFAAVNEFGKETRVVRRVVYNQQQEPPAPLPPAPPPIEATPSGTP